MGLCVFSRTISFLMIMRIYVLDLIIFIKSEIRFISHCVKLGHETVICVVCYTMLLLKYQDYVFILRVKGW